MAEGRVRWEVEDGVGRVVIDHPPVNALDAATRHALARAFDDLAGRGTDVRAVVLSGAGDRAFAAGADIRAFPDLTPGAARERLEQSHRMLAALEAFPRPVIAAIHGYCLGGGLELALCCDLRYAAEGARLGFPEVGLGIFPGNGGARRALDHLPLGRLKELIFTGEPIGAAEALRWGLVERVVPDGEVVEAAVDTARRIAARAPLAVAAAKRVLNRARELPVAEALAVETGEWSALAGTRDMKEGARAFLEKRSPRFQGR